MNLQGISIKEGKIGPNVSGDGREFGFIGNGVSVDDKLELGKVYTFRRPSDAEAIGIDAAYDASNSVRVYRHIAEFYRMAGSGKTLHIMLVSQDKKPVDMIADAKMLAVDSGGMISDMVFAFNPNSDYTANTLDGLNADVKEAIPALQGFADWCDENNLPLHTILEGRDISDNLSSCADLRALEAQSQPLHAEKVTLVAGQDWNYAEGLDDIGKKFADVGTFLGVIASMDWNRNPGEVETQNLTDVVLNAWLVGGLSNHKKYSEVFSELETLNDKGYVFPIRYQGMSGYWWNDGHTCVEVINDVQGNLNQHTIYYSHTMDMSKRALRRVYLPEVKKTKKLDDKGKLPVTMLEYYNSIGFIEFNRIAGNNLISKGEVYTDPESDLIIKKELILDFSVVPTGCINEMKGTINLKNK